MNCKTNYVANKSFYYLRLNSYHYKYFVITLLAHGEYKVFHTSFCSYFENADMLTGFKLINFAAYAIMPRCSESSSAISAAVSKGKTPRLSAPSIPENIIQTKNRFMNNFSLNVS